VRYSSLGFVDKNRNEIGQEIFESLERSTEGFVRGLLSSSSEETTASKAHSKRVTDRNSLDGDGAGSRERANSRGHPQAKGGLGGGSGGGKKAPSVISQFSTQLQDLIQKIRSMRSHFIRCLKPNNSLLPHSLDSLMIQSQLRCGGALGALKVFQIGFPNRMEFKYFVTRYACFISVCGSRNALTADVLSCIQLAKATSTDELWRTATSMLLDIISLTVTILSLTGGSGDSEGELLDGLDASNTSGIVQGLQMGKTQVFLKAAVFELLERLQMHSQIFIARILQRRRRALLITRQYRQSLRQGSGGSSSAVTKKSLASAPTVLLRYHAMESYLYIVHKRRSQVRNSISASIFLQRKVRVFLAVSWRKRILRGVTRLKACYRGAMARKCIYEMKVMAATRIQTTFRCHILAQRYLSMKLKAKILQTYVRRFLAIQAKRLKLRVVLQLQCLWRGTMARIRTVAYRLKLVSVCLSSLSSLLNSLR
jgi:hypothetical protein